MAFKEYGNYDGDRPCRTRPEEAGHGQRNCSTKPSPAPQRSIRRSTRSSSSITTMPNARSNGPARRPLHRRAVPAEGSRPLRGHAHHLGRQRPEGIRRRPNGTLAQRFLDAGVSIFGKSSSPEFGLMPTTESRLFGPTRNPWNLGAFVRRLVRRRGRGGRGAHPAGRACQRWRRLDPDPRLRIRRVRLEADPRAQSARPRSRRRLGRIFLRPCRQHQRARQRGR